MQFSAGVKSCYLFTKATYYFYCPTNVKIDPKGFFLSLHYINSVIYRFKCNFDDNHIGRMSQTLEAMINQYIPINIQKGNLDIFHRYANTPGRR